MGPTRNARIEEISKSSLELKGEDRDSFIEERCSGDEALRSAVNERVRQYEEARAYFGDLAGRLGLGGIGDAQFAVIEGQEFGKYVIEKMIGQGGMGLVYRARDTQLNRPVALKFLSAKYVDDDHAKERFMREARAAAALNHPNVVTVHEIIEYNGLSVIVMEYIEGQTLRSRMSAGAIEAEEAIAYTEQIGRGLAAAHESGIVHRDLKPANIILANNGVVKILDFGLAKLKDSSQITHDGSRMGTAAYMSPEQARGEEVDHRSDIWSLGVIMYEMLTGGRPFKGYYWEALLYAILNEEIKPLSVYSNRGIPKNLEEAVNKSLAKDLIHRYENMPDLLEDIINENSDSFKGTGLKSSDRHTVGRDKELVRLQESLERVRTSSGLLIGVGGEAGIGKTTLVEEFLYGVRRSGVKVHLAKGQCSERLAGTEAYLPFFDVMTDLLQQSKQIAELMREKAPWWYVQVASLSPDDPSNERILERVRHTTQEQVKRELAVFLQEASAKCPLLLFIEDLHWADVSSVDLIAYLTARFEHMRVMILTTYRPVEMQLNDHAFLKIKPDMLSRGQCEELVLKFLKKEELKEYLDLEYPGNDFSLDLPALLFDRTEGSPLFMADLIKDFEQKEVIAEMGGIWQLAKSIEQIQLDLPVSMKAMIERKIGQLLDADKAIMIVASVQGFEFDSALLAAVLDMDEEAVEERLQFLDEDLRFVEFLSEGEFPDGSLTLKYRFVHALYQNELFDSLTGTRRVRLCREVARVLSDFYASNVNEVAAELATLYEKGREYSEAIKCYDIAVEHASALFAYQEAVFLAQKGIDLLPALSESEDRDSLELSLVFNLGSALVAIKGYGDPEVGSAFAKANAISKRFVNHEKIESINHGLGLYYNVTLQFDVGIELYNQMLAKVDVEDNAYKYIYANNSLGIVYQFKGDFSRAEAHWSACHFTGGKLIQPSGNSIFSYMNEVYGLGHLAWNYWIEGYPDKAFTPSFEAKELAEASGNPFNEVHYYAFACFLHLCRGEFDKVEELARINLQISEENDYQLNIVWANMLLGIVDVFGKNVEDGIARIEEGLQFWKAVGMGVFVPFWEVTIADAYLKFGRIEEAFKLLEATEEMINETDHRMWEAELYRIRGNLFVSQGKNKEAESCYFQAIDIAKKQGAKSLELRSVIQLAELCYQNGMPSEGIRLLDEIMVFFSEGYHTKDLNSAKILLDYLSK